MRAARLVPPVLAVLLLALLAAPVLAGGRAAPGAGKAAEAYADEGYADEGYADEGYADEGYRQEIETWRRERNAGLAREDGWLTLVGLFWLQEGENGIGSGPDNRVVLPEGKAPARVGRLIRQGKAVRLEAEPGADVTADGKPVTSMALASDAGGKPTVLKLGTLTFHVIERPGDRVGVRVKDSASPARAAFHGLEHFPLDPSWRVEARFEPYRPAKPVPIPNVLGDVEPSPSPGAVVFERGGKTYRLDALEGEDGELFLIFADGTSGRETYGAGRFLDTPAPRDGKVTVDFNKAYNPPCAFTAFATCPLPPRQNKLALRIEAGEKKLGEGHP